MGRFFVVGATALMVLTGAAQAQVGSGRPNYGVSESNPGKLNGYGGIGSPRVGQLDAYAAADVTGSVGRSRKQVEVRPNLDRPDVRFK